MFKKEGRQNITPIDGNSEIIELFEKNAPKNSQLRLLLTTSDEIEDSSNDSSNESSAKDIPAAYAEEASKAETNEINDLGTKLYLNGQSGSDNNDGLSPASPLKTFDKAKEKAIKNQEIQEIVVTGTASLEGNISLEGTNAKIIRAKDFTGYLFTLSPGKKATLSNIVIEGNGSNPNLQRALIQLDGAQLYIKDRTVLRNNKTNAEGYHTMGGAIHAANRSTIYMQGGLIENNTAVYGGGIYLSHSDLNFSAGTIQNNLAKRHGPDAWNQIYAAGGAVCADNGSNVKISADAKILKNRSDEVGGGISIGSNQGTNRPNTLLMQGGTIDGNTAGATGGGIFIQAQLSKIINKATITAGQITHNKADASGKTNNAFGGGGIYVNGIAETFEAGGNVYHGTNGQLELHNAIITNNYAAYFGGGFAACPISVTKIYVTDGVAIYKNDSKGVGKDLFILSSDAFGTHSGNARYDFSKRMLGDVLYEWKGPKGKLLAFDHYKGTVPDNTALPLHTDHNGNKLTHKLAKVIISDNYSATCGGGIGSNGTTTFGKHHETTEIKVKKSWRSEDASLPESISVDLVVTLDGKEYVVETREITKEDGWKTVFKNLPKVIDGKEAVYSVKEKELDGYISEVTKKSDTEFEIVNEKNRKLIEIPVTKIWEDHKDKDNLRPESVTIKLFADGKDTGKSLELNEENDWKATFTNLPTSKDGKEIDYSLKELTVAGYTTSISGNVEKGFTIRNTREPKKPKVKISGSKTWLDNKDQAGKRPESITIRLLADGKEIDSKKVSEKDGWKWSFSGLNKYKNGKKIHYTITEDAVEDYTSEIKDFDVENSYTPGKTQVRVTKIWKDHGDQYDRRPHSVTVKLLANGEETGEELVLSEANDWTGSFTDLDEYKDGKKINYTVEEIGVRGYKSTIIGDSTKGYIIINSNKPNKPNKPNEPDKTRVSGSKTWKDDNNKEGDRPEEITIRLYADGVEIDKKTVTEKDGWNWSFDNLDEYKDGKKIKYTISEDKVDGYLSTVDGYDVRNILEPSKKIPTKKIPIKGNPKTGAGLAFNLVPSLASASLLLWISKKSSK